VNQRELKEALSHLVLMYSQQNLFAGFFRCFLILLGVFGFNLFKRSYQGHPSVFQFLLLFSEGLYASTFWVFSKGLEKMKLIRFTNISVKAFLFLFRDCTVLYNSAKVTRGRWVKLPDGFFFGLGINILLAFFTFFIFF